MAKDKVSKKTDAGERNKVFTAVRNVLCKVLNTNEREIKLCTKIFPRVLNQLTGWIFF